MSNQPRVSVITPTYNRPEYLKEAIASALAQTDGNLEIIVSDNDSTISPEPLIRAFADSRIRFFRQPQNLGMIANLLFACQQAQGKYIAFLMDDDVWEPEFLATLVPPLEADADLVLSFCDHSIIDAAGKIDAGATAACSRAFKRMELTAGRHCPFYRLALVDAAVSTATSAVMRRDWVDWQAIPLEVGGTFDSYLRYLYCRDGRAAFYVPERLTRYREHQFADTMQGGRGNAQSKIYKARAEIFCYQCFLADPQIAEFHPFFQAKLAFWMTTLGIGLMREKQIEDARKYLWRSLAQQRTIRTAAALWVSFLPFSHWF